MKASFSPDRIVEAVRRLGGVAAAAAACGVTEQAVYNWQSGTRPYARSLRRLADVSGVSAAWLVHEDEDQSARLAEGAPAYGCVPFTVPIEARAEFSRFAAHYGMSEGDAFRLIFDAFTGRILKQF